MVSARSSLSAAVVVVVFVAATLLAHGPRTIEGARILAVESIAGKSHWNFMRAVLRALTDRGHHVTVFTPFADGDRANYTEVDMSKEFPIKLDMQLAEILENFVKPTTLIPLSVLMSRTLCDVIYANGRMQDTLRRGPTAGDFDVVIVEPLNSDCVTHVAAVLQLPVVFIVPSPMITYRERAFLGHQPNPAAVSHMLADHAVPKSFRQRFANVVLSAYSVLSCLYTETVLKYTEPRQYDLQAPVKPSALFVNTHHITEAPRPMPPNVVQIGGIHLDPPKDIPDDILKFIEDSPNGVIYFTFGSVVKMSTLPDYIQEAFKDALAQVPQRVLWKYEGEMENMPKNVMIKKWFPQRDILLHHKVKLFISHGGISGVYEAVDAGVPVLGFPIFYDQPRNIDNLVEAGMAISLDLLTVSKDKFLNAILELVNNEKYTKNAKIASERFKDRPMSPENSVVYWTEYIVRHKGAPHLKSPALNLSWYQYLLLDVIAVALLLISVVSFVIYTILKVVYKYSLRHLQSIKVKNE